MMADRATHRTWGKLPGERVEMLVDLTTGTLVFYAGGSCVDAEIAFPPCGVRFWFAAEAHTVPRSPPLSVPSPH